MTIKKTRSYNKNKTVNTNSPPIILHNIMWYFILIISILTEYQTIISSFKLNQHNIPLIYYISLFVLFIFGHILGFMAPILIIFSTISLYIYKQKFFDSYFYLYLGISIIYINLLSWLSIIFSDNYYSGIIGALFGVNLLNTLSPLVYYIINILSMYFGVIIALRREFLLSVRQTKTYIKNFLLYIKDNINNKHHQKDNELDNKILDDQDASKSTIAVNSINLPPDIDQIQAKNTSSVNTKKASSTNDNIFNYQTQEVYDVLELNNTGEKLDSNGDINIDNNDNKVINKENNVDESMVIKLSDLSYKYPALSLLKRQLKKTNIKGSKEIQDRIQLINSVFKEFKIDAQIVNYITGPTVTCYEVVLGARVKVEKILDISRNISYVIGVPNIRIIAPIPNKSAVGIEIPNKYRSNVMLGDVMNDAEANRNQSLTLVALGVDIEAKNLFCDLAKMPHLLIAGATGAGKSTCINTVIISLILRAHPDKLKLILIDPKKVELSAYKNIPHLITPIITNPQHAVNILAWVASEVDNRYNLFAKNSVRNIGDYNKQNNEIYLPYIIVIIDELADLMMVASKDIEKYIVRITQLARAAGIHLIVATQRPSVNVITGLIKANIPSRLGFSTASATDSRVILDRNGTESLTGQGDGLFLPIGSMYPIRFQGAYISDEEINKIIDSCDKDYTNNYNIAVYNDAVQKSSNQSQQNDNTQQDDFKFIPEAINVIFTAKVASASLLQRRMRIGFSKAGRLIDLLESNNIIGPNNSSKGRKVLIATEEEKEQIIEELQKKNLTNNNI